MVHDINRELIALTSDGIKSDGDYQKALILIEKLIENYDANILFIEALGRLIESYENNEEEAFHRRKPQLNPATATLRVLMDQHGLTAQDFKSEIGNEELVMQVL